MKKISATEYSVSKGDPVLVNFYGNGIVGYEKRKGVVLSNWSSLSGERQVHVRVTVPRWGGREKNIDHFYNPHDVFVEVEE